MIGLESPVDCLDGMIDSNLNYCAVEQSGRTWTRRRCCDDLHRDGIRVNPPKLLACLPPGVHTEIAFDSAIPGLVIGGVQIHPLFVGHLTPPLQEGDGIRTYGMSKLPCSVLSDFQDLLCDQRRRCGVSQ